MHATDDFKKKRKIPVKVNQMKTVTDPKMI